MVSTELLSVKPEYVFQYVLVHPVSPRNKDTSRTGVFLSE